MARECSLLPGSCLHYFQMFVFSGTANSPRGPTAGNEAVAQGADDELEIAKILSEDEIVIPR